MLSRRPRRAAQGRQTSPSELPLCQPLEPRLALSATVTVDGVLVVIGSPTADTVVATAGGNGVVTLSGVPGVPNGTQFTGVNSVAIDVKSGDDSVTVSGNLRNTIGQPAGLSILGGNGADTINLSGLLNASPIFVNGGNGNDALTGSQVADLLKGGKGNDTAFGGPANDRLDGQKGNDLLVGSTGNDSCFGGDGADICYGNEGDDDLHGGKGPDQLFGSLDTDLLFGDQGRDTFFGSFAEQQDYNPSDAYWSNAFTQSATHAMLSGVFWDRLAAGEQGGILSPALVHLTNTVLTANQATIVQQNAFFDDLQGLPDPTISSFGVALANLTNSFSPPIASNPSIYTTSRLTTLFRNMQAVTPSSIRVAFSTMNTAITNSLNDNNFFIDARALPPAGPSTSFLFAMDDFLNRGIDIRY